MSGNVWRLVYLLLMVTAAFEDSRKKHLDNKLVLGQSVVVFLYVVGYKYSLYTYGANLLISMIFYICLYYLLYDRGIGGADAKLLIVSGSMFGFWGSLWILMLGSVTCLAFNIFYIRRKTFEPFALVPYLTLGTAVYMCFM